MVPESRAPLHPPRWSQHTGRSSLFTVYCLALSPNFLLIHTPFLFLNKEMPFPATSEGCFEHKGGWTDPCGDIPRSTEPAQLKQGLTAKQQEAAALHLGAVSGSFRRVYQMSPYPLPGAAHEYCGLCQLRNTQESRTVHFLGTPVPNRMLQPHSGFLGSPLPMIQSQGQVPAIQKPGFATVEGGDKIIIFVLTSFCFVLF